MNPKFSPKQLAACCLEPAVSCSRSRCGACSPPDSVNMLFIFSHIEYDCRPKFLILNELSAEY